MPPPPVPPTTDNKPTHLDPSPLGTKEYWSSLYSTDLATRQSTIPSHTGTTWFDDAGAEAKTIRYLASLAEHKAKASSSSTPSLGLSLQTTSFLDLGTGNGSLLFALRKAGWEGLMVGVDYAQESVDLAHGIWKDIVENGWDGEDSDDDTDEDDDHPAQSSSPIHFHVLDILSLADPNTTLPSWIPRNGFDVVLDKGTFDAVSLSADIDPATGNRIVESYAAAAKRFLKKPDGRMIVTSCNWTDSELERWFCGGDSTHADSGHVQQLKVVDKVPYRKFQFGGKEGSVVVGLVFGWI